MRVVEDNEMRRGGMEVKVCEELEGRKLDEGR